MDNESAYAIIEELEKIRESSEKRNEILMEIVDRLQRIYNVV